LQATAKIPGKNSCLLSLTHITKVHFTVLINYSQSFTELIDTSHKDEEQEEEK